MPESFFPTTTLRAVCFAGQKLTMYHQLSYNDARRIANDTAISTYDRKVI
jgi:hypothetical protein